MFVCVVLVLLGFTHSLPILSWINLGKDCHSLLLIVQAGIMLDTKVLKHRVRYVEGVIAAKHLEESEPHPSPRDSPFQLFLHR